ncbi:MAG: dihydrolipoyl dehydrogenase, partial [Candidatus Krumholzibacteriota bacterium]|nr:dihydrolipoyl dehydrogenase [Candidatus Krumholzibacteriota bacterium]
MHEAAHASEIGVDFGRPRLDIDRLRQWKESVVERQTGGLGQLVKARKVAYIRGTGTYSAPHTIDVDLAGGDREVVTFEHSIVASGSRPATVPAFDIGSPRVIDSTGALELQDVPRTMLVVGGGYIGLELGSVYAALGTRVSVVEMMPDLLPGADRDLVKVLRKRVETTFESVLVNTRVDRIKELKSGIKVTFNGDEAPAAPITYEKVLVSVGRKPNSSNLGLENTAVALDERGFIEVSERMQTAEPSIYAVGDVVGDPMLAHKASHEGRTAVEAIRGEKVAFEPAAIPAVIFTDPEIAWAGLTETEAKERNIEVKVARFPWAASGRASTLERTDGLTKLLIDPKSERVLGVGIVGVGAGELIAEGVLAIEMAALASDLKHTIHPHPTLSETVMEAAEVFYGQSTHVYRPRRD